MKNMTPIVNLIVAACENGGIGVNGNLPWRLKNELAYFARMTRGASDPNKKNAVIMGRRTWESIPEKLRPLSGRLNVVLSTTLSIADKKDLIIERTLESAIAALQQPPLSEECESIWVIGGHSVYNEAMASKYCHRIYLTRIKKDFDCDTFLPAIDCARFTLVKDSRVPNGLQEENGIQYEYLVYERMHD